MADFNIEYVIRVIDKFSPIINKLQQDLKKTEVQSRTLNFRMKTLTASSFSLGKMLFTRLTLPIIGLGSYVMKTASNFEEMQISLEGVLGSSAKAKEVLEGIKTMTMKAPLSAEELTQATIKLINFGVKTTDVADRLKQLSTLSLGAGVDINILTSVLARAYTGLPTHVRSLTLIARQIPIWGAIQKVAGLSDKAFALWKKHAGVAISATIMLKALNLLTKENSALSDAAIRRSNSMKGAIKEIHAAMRNYVDDIAQAVFGEKNMASVLLNIRDYLADNEKTFRAFLENNKELMKMGVMLLKILAILAPLALAFSAISAIIATFMNPINLAIAGLLAMGAAALYVYNKFEKTREILKDVLTFFTPLGFLANLIDTKKTAINAANVMDKKVGVNSAQQHTINSNVGITIKDKNDWVKTFTIEAARGIRFFLGDNMAFSNI